MDNIVKNKLNQIIDTMDGLRVQFDELMYGTDQIDDSLMDKITAAHDYLCKAEDELI